MEEILEMLKDCVLKEMQEPGRANTKEMGEAIDMIKDVAAAMYYIETVHAMRDYPDKYHDKLTSVI